MRQVADACVKKGTTIFSNFERLANALTALYPDKSEEEHLPDAKLVVSMVKLERIEINPKVMMGKPVIRGTRITVELVLRKLSEGASEKDLIDAYPKLKSADIKAAIKYAADTLAHEETVITGASKRKSGK